MIWGWVLLIVMTHTKPSTVSVQYGFATEAECRQVAAQAVPPLDKWTCFKSSKS